MAARRSWPRPVIRPSAPWRWLPVGRRRCCSSSTLPLAPDSPAPLKLARNRFSDHDRLSISFVLDSLTRTGCLDAGGFLVASGRGQHLWTHFSHGWPTFFFLHQSETSDGTTGVVLWCFRAWCCRVFFRPNRLRFGGGLLGWARVPFAIGVVNGFRPSHSSFAFCFYRIFTGCYRVLVTRPTLKGVVVFDAPGTEFLFFCFYFWPNPSSWRRFRSMLTGWRRVSTTTTRCLRNFETKPTRFWWRGAFGFDSRGFFWLFGVFFFLFTGRDSGSTVVYRVECGCDSPSGAVDGFLSLGAVSGAAGRPPQRDVDGKRRRMRPTLPSCCFFLFSLFLFFFYAVSSSSSSSASSSSSFFWFFSLFF